MERENGKLGFVYLVGAGTGDPELLTLKALKVINKADVILYDKLVGDKIVDFIKNEGKLLIYAGKDSCEKGEVRQAEINKLMKKYAEEGKVVVRLKGGDPFVFGRGCIEAEFLKKEGIPYEVIPGVSSISAVPTSAGIPLTHPELSSLVLVVTGREDVRRWSKAFIEGTIVILMGRDKIERICENLISEGRDPETPVAVIVDGTLDSQRTILGTLSTIAEKVRKRQIKGPTLIVVGDVVGFAKGLGIDHES
jgi:uroporphyrin-III C-methyltransferase